MIADEIEGWLVERIAAYAELRVEEIDVRIPFERYGLDSRTASSV